MKSNNQNQIGVSADGHSIHLIKQLGLGIVKQAILEGLMEIATPETEYEATTILDFKKDLNNCKCEKDSLRFALLFDRVLADDSDLWGNILFDSDPDMDDSSSRPLIDNISERLSRWVEITNDEDETFDIHNLWYNANVEVEGISEQERSMMRSHFANNMSLLEPMIWGSWRESVVNPDIDRSVIRDIFDLMIASPEVLWFIKNTKYDSDAYNDPEWWRAPFAPLAKKYDLSDNTIFYFQNLIYRTCLKGLGALIKVKKASKEKAILALKDFPVMKSRNLEDLRWINLHLNNEMLVTIHILLEEVEILPKITSFKDIFQIKSNRIFKEFNQLLIQWVMTIALGDIKNEKLIRKEIHSANQSLKTIARCERVGGLITYFYIPLMIAREAVLPNMGPKAGIDSFGLIDLKDWTKFENKWLMLAPWW